MKKTQLKDLLRNIKGQLISWLSIVVIAMMAITAFLGVRFSSKSLYDDANRIYGNSNYRDIELFSTVLFDENDAEQIRKVESVEDAEGVYSVGLSVNFKNESKGVDVVSLTERINVPEVFSGRLPQDRSECALEEEVASAIGAGIGDTVTIEDPNDYLLNKSFTVVGIVCHPDNLASEGQVPGNRYVVVTKDAINKETFLDCYTKIEVLLKDLGRSDRYKKGYQDTVSDHLEDFEELSEQSSKAKVEKYQKVIDEYQTKLDEAKEQLEEARKQLDEAQKEIGENRDKLNGYAKELETGKQKLADAKKQIDEATPQIEAAQAKLSEAKAKLDEAKKTLETTYRQLLVARRYASKRAPEGIDWETDENFNVDDPNLTLKKFPLTKTFTIDLTEEIRPQVYAGLRTLNTKQILEFYLSSGGSLFELLNLEDDEILRSVLIERLYAKDGSGNYVISDSFLRALIGKYPSGWGISNDTGSEEIRSILKDRIEDAEVRRGMELMNSFGAKIWDVGDNVEGFIENKVNGLSYEQLKRLLPNGYLDRAKEDYGYYQDWMKEVDPDNMMGEEDFLRNQIADTIREYNVVYQIADKVLGLSNDQNAIMEYLENHSGRKNTVHKAMRQAVINKVRAMSIAELTDTPLNEYGDEMESISEVVFSDQFYFDNYESDNEGLYYDVTQYPEDQTVSQIEALNKDLEGNVARLDDGELLRIYQRISNGDLSEIVSAIDSAGDQGETRERLCIETGDNMISYALTLLGQGFDLGKEAEDKALTNINKAAKKWEEGHAEYLNGLNQYRAGKAEFDSRYAEYLRGQKEYEDGLATYNSSLAEYNRGLKQLTEAEGQIEEKEKEYADKLAEYNKGLEELERYKSMIDHPTRGKWVALSPMQSASYLGIDTVANSFSSISSTFSMLFVFVGALVIYATVGKIIEEQRTLVGTTKALGFFNSEVFRKYLGFGVSATLLGTLLGIIIGSTVLQKALLNQAMSFFHLGEGVLHFGKRDVAIVVALALILSASSVFLACFRMIRTPVKDLMQPETPKARKKKNRNHRGSLYSRLIIRNILSDPKRIIVTIVSIAGCCALLVIGFTVRHAISASSTRQFEELMTYDLHVNYSEKANENVKAEIEEVLDRYHVSYTDVAYLNQPYVVDGRMLLTRLLVAEKDQIGSFYRLNDPDTGKPLDLKDGIYVSKKKAEKHGLAPGEAIHFLDGDYDDRSNPVTGFYECYANNVTFMTAQAYRDTFGKDVQNSRYLIISNGADEEAMKKDLLNIVGVTGVAPSSEERVQSESFVSIANYVLILLTVMAAVMAYFIIFNLTNTYISQRRRELTVMRINGFTVNEVRNYVSREMYLTSILGILFGWLTGAALGRHITILLENEAVYERGIYLPGWLIAAAVTMLFTVIINRLSLRKVKDLKLTDI